LEFSSPRGQAVHVVVWPPVQVQSEHVERMRPLQLSSSELHELAAMPPRMTLTRTKGRAMKIARNRDVIV
jgi:hypothetical protein